MKSFKDFYFGEHDLLDKDGIIDVVVQTKKFNKLEKETTRNAKILQLNSSSNQRSWLVKTNRRLYKLLDDRRKPDTIINWSFPLNKVSGATVTVDEEREKRWYVRFSFKPDRRYNIKKSLCTLEQINDFIS